MLTETPVHKHCYSSINYISFYCVCVIKNSGNRKSIKNYKQVQFYGQVVIKI